MTSTSFRGAQDRKQHSSRVDGVDTLDSMPNRGLKAAKLPPSNSNVYEFNEKQFESALSEIQGGKNNTSINQTSDIESGSKSLQ